MDDLDIILDGWKNYIFPDPVTEELAKKRLSTCYGCEFRNTIINKCKLCGCPIGPSIRASAKKCPDGRW
jgi:hypothetical protein